MPILGIIASSRPSAAVDTGAMFPLQVITVGPTAVSEINFTNIPSTYSHLQLRMFANASATQDCVIQFNGNTSNIYDIHFLVGTGSSVVSGASLNRSSIGWKTITSTANIFSAGIMDILDYANTNKNKTTRALSGEDTNGDGAIVLHSGLWRSTSAISSMRIFLFSGGNFTTNTQFALYAVKAAS